jgi:polyisoprenyl-teichoic acid--peptidoglycan teichoic acid transferase
MDPAASAKILSQNFGLDVVNSAGETGESPADRTPHIAIQNASGKPELGQAAAAKLKALGFGDTYVIEDWPESIDRTQIIVQRGDNLAAQGLLQKLAIGQIDDSSTGDFESDLTLRLGRDWK